jgi:hypothetical protein
MKNLSILTVAIVVGVLGFLLYSETIELREQRERVRDLTATLNSLRSAQSTVSLDVQEKCAKQAEKEAEADVRQKSSMTDFSSHFNPKLGKCFVEIKDGRSDMTAPGTFMISRLVVDAFEGKVYGSYVWQSEKGKKAFEVQPLDCTVKLPSGEESTCKSSDEFDELVKQYME